MSIIVHRVLLAAVCASSLAVAPAQAQTDRDILLDSLLKCSEIRNQAARWTCYDEHISHSGFSPSGEQKPEQSSDVQKRSDASSGGTALSAGTEHRPPARTLSRQITSQPEVISEKQPDSITLAIATVIERAPGLYVVTLEDGDVWEFLDHMPLSYRPPLNGSFVKIDRGALGSYRMRFDQQQPVRVRRTR